MTNAIRVSGYHRNNSFFFFIFYLRRYMLKTCLTIAAEGWVYEAPYAEDQKSCSKLGEIHLGSSPAEVKLLLSKFLYKPRLQVGSLLSGSLVWQQPPTGWTRQACCNLCVAQKTDVDSRLRSTTAGFPIQFLREPQLLHVFTPSLPVSAR